MKSNRKIISLLLAVCLIIGLMPAASFAADNAIGIKVDKDTVDFGTVEEGYTQPEAETITITTASAVGFELATGAELKIVLPESENYTIKAVTGFEEDDTATITTTSAGVQFSIQPNADLTAGNYDEDININTAEGKLAATVKASFEVTKAAEPGVEPSIELSQTEATVTVGKTVDVSEFVTNKDEFTTLKYASLNEDKATVDENGVVTGVAATEENMPVEIQVVGTTSTDFTTTAAIALTVNAAPTEPESPVVNVTPSETGNTASATVSDTELAATVNSAVAAGTPDVTIKVETSEGIENVDLTIPTSAISTLASTEKATLTLSTNVATIALDTTAIKAIVDGAENGYATVSIATVAKEDLTAEQQAVVGDAPVYDFSIKAGNVVISSFNDGTATVSIPYTPADADKKVVVYYLNEATNKLESCETNYANGTVTFTTNHFSKYVIGYANDTTDPDEPGTTTPTAISFKLTDTYEKVKKGKTLDLTQYIADYKTLKDQATFSYTSSDDETASVNKNGVVTGNDVGDAVITIKATANDGYVFGTTSSATATFEINVFKSSSSSGGGGGSSSSTTTTDEDKDEDEDKTEVTEPDDETTDSDDETTSETLTAEEVSKIFADVSANDWFANDVAYVYSNGLMAGVSDTTFAPNSTATRAMAVTILYRLENEPAVSGSNTFTDVANDTWYTNAVIWASENGVMAGYGDGIFGTNDNITREQLATIFYNYAKLKGYDTTVSGSVSAFTDGANVSSWAKEAVEWAIGSGLMSGKGNGVLDPNGTATRAEFASMIRRFIG